ncbi:nuclear export factor GLE1 [Mycolicibacter sinensis]|uniref:Nuclear export factor GLE1 n=2 Tax=Mycolicibacter TaxID=1073531 RepID=A0A1A2NKX2_MYCSD|nr:nuclear export factor GLE1 [Mycolicibacter sinensis]OBI25829.1 nuclear export factor GLE1 [Mycolicibacter sinensis]
MSRAVQRGSTEERRSWDRRMSRAGALAAAIVATGWAVGTGPAGAHVHASSPGAVRGGVAMVTFEVPNESPTGSATTELTVTLPDVASARTETKPGWTARLDRDAKSGAVRSVTWTADAGGIGADQFGLFRIAMKLPDADTVDFPSAQRYADGTVVRWDQAPPPGGGEAERPVPSLHLAAGPAAPPEHHAQHPAPAVSAGPAPTTESGSGGSQHADNAARLLGGAALLVAALAAALALVRRRA